MSSLSIVLSLYSVLYKVAFWPWVLEQAAVSASDMFSYVFLNLVWVKVVMVLDCGALLCLGVGFPF